MADDPRGKKNKHGNATAKPTLTAEQLVEMAKRDDRIRIEPKPNSWRRRHPLLPPREVVEAMIDRRPHKPVASKMDPSSKPSLRITPQEAVDIGIIQELNRLFLNPRGYALEVIIGDHIDGIGETVLGIGHIQDHKDDPAVLLWTEKDKPCPKKARQVEARRVNASAIRDAELGTVDGIQPLADDDPDADDSDKSD